MVLPFVRDFFADVEKLPAFSRVVSHLRANSGRVRVSGVNPAAKCLLIAELQNLRDYLQNEGQRVQREITEYAHMSQAATKSTKIIAESLAQWKQSAEGTRAARG